MYAIDNACARHDSTSKLPSISQLIGPGWRPHYDWNPNSSPSPGRSLSSIHSPLPGNDTTSPSTAENMQGSPFSSFTSTVTDVPRPNNRAIVLSSREDDPAEASSPTPHRDSLRDLDTRWSTPETVYSRGTSEALVENIQRSSFPSTSDPPATDCNVDADAAFLLRTLALSQHNTTFAIPTLSDLNRCMAIDPQSLEKTVQCLTELQLSNQAICLGAALIPRACSLRRETPIFPPDSPWYDEEEKPLATVAVALRVAQLFLEEGETHGKETFYTTWGFYPYSDLTRFAKVLVDPKAKSTVASVDWDRWCELKREFQRTFDLEIRSSAESLSMDNR